MKKILMTIAMLAMILPTFGQKLNSRGEKMVSSIFSYEYHPTLYPDGKLMFTILFNYDDNGDMISLKASNGKSYYFLERDGDDIKLTHYYNGEKIKNGETHIIKLNNYGLVSSWKKIDSHEDESFYTYSLNEYKYIYNENFREYTLQEIVNTSMWVHYGGRDKYEGETRHHLYTYRNGNPYWSLDGYTKDGIFTREIDDMNISLYGIIKCMTKQIPSSFLLFLTPWCPLPNKNLIIGDLNSAGRQIASYEYEYQMGNVIGIKRYRDMRSRKDPLLENSLYISYVED